MNTINTGTTIVGFYYSVIQTEEMATRMICELQELQQVVRKSISICSDQIQASLAHILQWAVHGHLGCGSVLSQETQTNVELTQDLYTNKTVCRNSTKKSNTRTSYLNQ